MVEVSKIYVISNEGILVAFNTTQFPRKTMEKLVHALNISKCWCDKVLMHD